MCVLFTGKQTKEETVDESNSSHCFTNLEQETLYRISVHSILGSAEGAAVSILHPTGVSSLAMKSVFWEKSEWWTKFCRYYMQNEIKVNLLQKCCLLNVS